MTTDFSQPQRQSPIGLLVMVADVIRGVIKSMWPVLVVFILRSDGMSKVYAFGSTAGLLVFFGVVAYLKYRNFTFYIDQQNAEFIVNSGIFNKTRTAIRLDRIQQVNISQSLIQRIINVYELEIDTAGTSNEEAKIKAVSHEVALALKQQLLENVTTSDFSEVEHSEDIGSTIEGSPFIRIDLVTLIKVGLTSNYLRTISLLLAFVITMFDNFNQLRDDEAFQGQELEGYFDEQQLIQSAFIGIFILIAGVLLLNLIRVLIKYFDYTVAKQRGSLLLSYGLLSKKSTIIKPEKVQIVRLTRNYFQRKMDITEIKIKQASSGGEEVNKNLAVDIPGVSTTQTNSILNLLFQIIPEKGIMLKPNYRRLVFSLFIRIVLPLGILATVGYFAAPNLFDFFIAVPLYILLVGTAVYFGFRNYRLFVGLDFIIKQSGVWDISNEIIEPSKIQAISTSQLFWHKGLDIGTLTIHTAGGDLIFNLGNWTTINQYVNLWLRDVERNDNNWM